MKMRMEQKKHELKEIERDNLSSIKQQLMQMASRNRWGTNEDLIHIHETQQSSPMVYPPTVDSRDRDSHHSVPLQQQTVPKLTPKINLQNMSPVKMHMIQNKENE